MIFRGKYLHLKSTVPEARYFPTRFNPHQFIICLAVTCLVSCVCSEKHGSLEEMLPLVLYMHFSKTFDVYKWKPLMHTFFMSLIPPNFCFILCCIYYDARLQETLLYFISDLQFSIAGFGLSFTCHVLLMCHLYWSFHYSGRHKAFRLLQRMFGSGRSV